MSPGVLFREGMRLLSEGILAGALFLLILSASASTALAAQAGDAPLHAAEVPEFHREPWHWRCVWLLVGALITGVVFLILHHSADRILASLRRQGDAGLAGSWTEATLLRVPRDSERHWHLNFQNQAYKLKVEKRNDSHATAEGIVQCREGRHTVGNFSLEHNKAKPNHLDLRLTIGDRQLVATLRKS